MLDRLVESRDTSGENRRRTGLLLTTFVLMSALMITGWVWSLYGKDFGMSDDLELSTLVAPVPVMEDEPPPPPEESKPEKQQTQQEDVQQTTRTELIKNLEMAPQKAPEETSVTKSNIPPAPSFNTVQGERNVDRTSSGPVRENSSGDGGGGFQTTATPAPTPEPEDKPAPAAPPPPPPKPKVPKVISGGVVNGKAINLPTPTYPPAARAMGAKGAVNVAVKIDENGNVVSASATSGHPLLRAAAVSAARSAKFAPTKLSGEPVSVTGVIVYNFNP